MKQTLEDLWYSWQSQDKAEITDEMREIRHRLVHQEEILRGEMTPGQMELLDRYSSCSGELNAVCEKEAFLRGVSFAVRFLLEALQG